MLACARIGAVHSIVFGGFSPDALAQRIIDCKSNFVITADEGLRGGKTVPLKANTDEAMRDRCSKHTQGQERSGRAPHRRQDRLDRQAAIFGIMMKWRWPNRSASRNR